MVSPAHWDFTYSYDHRGQLMQIRDAVGRSTRYKRDGSGRIVEVDLLREDGRLSGKHVLHYGPGNRPTEEQVYDRDGALSGRLKFSYDALGRRSETVDQLGFVEKIMRHTYDTSGNIATMEEIQPIGRAMWVYSYESVDSQGNWTKRTKGQEAVKFGKKVVVPVEITYRTLTYTTNEPAEPHADTCLVLFPRFFQGTGTIRVCASPSTRAQRRMRLGTEDYLHRERTSRMGTASSL
jgi:YD repeat-containing protein